MEHGTWNMDMDMDIMEHETWTYTWTWTWTWTWTYMDIHGTWRWRWRWRWIWAHRTTAGLVCPINPENIAYARGQEELSRVAVLEAEKASLQAELDAERTQCAVDKSLNAVSVLSKLEKGTISLIFD